MSDESATIYFWPRYVTVSRRPDPCWALSREIIGESQGTGAGPVGLGGAACSAAFGGAAAVAGFSGGDWLPPGMDSPASVLGSPLRGGVGDLVSSGIATEGTNLRRRGRLRRTITINSLQTKCQSRRWEVSPRYFLCSA